MGYLDEDEDDITNFSEGCTLQGWQFSVDGMRVQNEMPIDTTRRQPNALASGAARTSDFDAIRSAPQALASGVARNSTIRRLTAPQQIRG